MGDGLLNRVREARTLTGWTQAELAERTEVSRKTINTIENSVFVPSTILALRLARVFNCPVESLFQLPD